MVNPYKKEYYMFTFSKLVLYTCALLCVSLSCIVMILQPFLTLSCEYIPTGHEPIFHNPQYVYDPCRHYREAKLLWLTIEECQHGRRLVWATVFGCFIGWERRNADRPAGIRTMALVSLGSCLFSICSTFAFLSGPMSWDSSRVSAAIPSGVGFLGSALIFKHTTSEENAWHEVHGLTTAASVWLSAAVGIACAGSLYFVATLTTCIVLVLLRFGPRTSYQIDQEDEAEENAEMMDIMEQSEAGDIMGSMTTNRDIMASMTTNRSSYSAISKGILDPEMQCIIPPMKERSSRMSKTLSSRKLRPSLI